MEAREATSTRCGRCGRTRRSALGYAHDATDGQADAFADAEAYGDPGAFADAIPNTDAKAHADSKTNAARRDLTAEPAPLMIGSRSLHRDVLRELPVDDVLVVELACRGELEGLSRLGPARGKDVARP